MKDLKKIICGFTIIMCVCVSVKVQGQTTDHMNSYNTALNYYSSGDYASSLSILSGFMNPIESDPSVWINGGPGYIELIYKVYRLSAACYYNGGDPGSADVIVDNLVFVLGDYYYESDIINRYNSTSIGGY